nr:MAG TPA: Frog antimicrobial peptide [Caudoviricetes sp.]
MARKRGKRPKTTRTKDYTVDILVATISGALGNLICEVIKRILGW